MYALLRTFRRGSEIGVTCLMGMRQKLESIKEERRRFTGIFAAYGKKAGFRGRRSQETILLRDVRDITNATLVTDHLWLNLTKEFADLQLKQGDAVAFDARVKKYVKGYVNTRGKIDNRRHDYKLTHPTKVQKIDLLTM